MRDRIPHASTVGRDGTRDLAAGSELARELTTYGDDLLWQHLCDLPAFRALLRAVEAGLYTGLPLVRPVLDLGCGDGHFASVAFRAPLDVGLDLCWAELAEARTRDAHQLLTRAEGVRIPCPAGAFATVVGNSVLEHISLPQAVLEEVARVLRPDGFFYFSVPSPDFLRFLTLGWLLDKLGAPSLAEAYRRFFNSISNHQHCDTVAVWRDRLESSGMCLARWWAYFPRAGLAAFEWLHYFGLPSLVCRRLLGRWVLCPSRSNLRLTELLVRPFYEHCVRWRGDGAYLFFVARKRSTPAAGDRQ